MIVRRVAVALWTAVVAAIAISGAAGSSAAASGSYPYPPVAALPTPSLPPWIAQISPTGQADPLAQIRVRFNAPVIPLEELESAQTQAALGHFTIVPALPGTWRFVTPRMAIFEVNRALPLATRARVTLTAGLADLDGDKLARDLSWTFNTEPLTIGSPDPGPYSLTPKIELDTSSKVDLESLRRRTTMINERSGATIPISIEPMPTTSPTMNPFVPHFMVMRVATPQLKFEELDASGSYEILPRRALAKKSNYRLIISAGVAPAYGNIPTTDRNEASVFTYEPLALLFAGVADAATDHTRAQARFVDGTPTLRFNNDVDEKSTQLLIGVVPKPRTRQGTTSILNIGGAIVSVDPWVLRPDTTYTLSVGVGLKDTWGQSLGSPATVTMTTSDIASDFSTLEGWHVFPATLRFKLPANVISLPDDQYEASFAPLSPAALVYSLYEGMPWYGWHNPGRSPYGLPNVLSWPAIDLPGTRNTPTTLDLGLLQRLGGQYGVLTYGMSAKIFGTLYDTPDSLVVTYGRINVTNIGLFVQLMPREAFALVHRLSDGMPIANARVDFYVRRLNKSANGPAPCATGMTGSDGIAIIDAAVIRRCMPWHDTSRAEDGAGPAMIAVAHAGFDWTVADLGTGEYGGSPFYFGWAPDAIRSKGAMFSDRGLYQPGEKASFAGYAFFLRDDVLHRDENSEYDFVLRSPDGTTRDLGSHRTDNFGTVTLDTVLPANAALGTYTLTASSAAGVVLACDFRVAEFKAPNYKVDLSTDRKFAIEGEIVTAKGQSDYLFGQPVDGAKTTFHVTRSRTDFTPPGWEEKSYSWGPEYAPLWEPVWSSEVLTSTGSTNQTGASSQAITIVHDLPFPMAYSTEMTVSDASNLAVAASTSFTALPNAVQIGVNADYLVPAGKPIAVSIVTTDAEGKQVARPRIRVTLSRLGWDKNDQPYLVPGPASVVATAESRPAQASLVPRKPGWYRVSANFDDASSHASATDRDVWVYGPGEAEWGNESDTRGVALQLDKKSYEPGDRATLLVKSPYADADLYLAVIRNGSLWRSYQHVTGSAPTVSFTVDPKMAPGAQIEAVLVRRGSPIESSAPGSVTSLVRFGSVWLNVDLARHYLQINVAPQLDRLLPGSTQTIDLQSSDYAGKPTAGEFVVVVADESIIQLTGYTLPDLVRAVYDGWPVSAISGDNRLAADLVQPEPSKLDQPPAPAPLFRPGTSDVYALSAKVLGHVTMQAATSGAQPAPAAIRVNFQQLAYFNGAVRTDENGHATVSFKVPDNLTTWRVLVVAEGETPADDSSDYRFGNGAATFIVTKALVANPLLPQFARPGDVFDGGIATNNTTGIIGTMAINGSLAGGLAFDQNGKLSPSISAQLPASAGTQSARYSMMVGAASPSAVEFHVALGPESDAFRVPFSIRPLEVTESVVETGVTESEAAIGLSVDPDVNLTAGGLQITMASTLLPEIIVPAKDCFLFENLPFAEPLSSRLMVAADLKILGKKYGQTAIGIDPIAESTEDLLELAKLQRQDGGFAWWPGDKESNPYLTGYAAQALGRANTAGIDVDASMLANTVSYLQQRLEDPDPRNFCFADAACIERLRFEAMLGLEALGHASEEHLGSVYAARDKFDLVSQIELASYMTRFPAWKPDADAMAAKIQELVYETGRYATLNVPDDMWWFDSITKGQAEIVRLYVAERYDAAQTDRVVRSLLALRRKGSWANTYDDAQALNAMIDYAALEPEPPAFSATALLGTKQVGFDRFKGYANSVQDTFVPIAQILKGPSVLLLQKDGTGSLHYVVSYSYRLNGDQPGVEEGLLVSRDVRAAGNDTVVAHMRLAKASGAVTLPAGRMYDVGVTIVVDHPVNQVVIVDPLPAGMEAVDTSFDTSPQLQAATSSSWQIDYQQIHDDRIVAFANYLAPGIYTMQYLARTVTPGTYEWPGTQAFLEYAPDEFGRAATSTLTVTP